MCNSRIFSLAKIRIINKTNKTKLIFPVARGSSFRFRNERTAGGLDVIDRVAIELEHFGRLRLLLFVAAHGESVLRYLDENVVAFLPLFPDAFTPCVQVPGKVSWTIELSNDTSHDQTYSSFFIVWKKNSLFFVCFAALNRKGQTWKAAISCVTNKRPREIKEKKIDKI